MSVIARKYCSATKPRMLVVLTGTRWPKKSLMFRITTAASVGPMYADRITPQAFSPRTMKLPNRSVKSTLSLVRPGPGGDPERRLCRPERQDKRSAPSRTRACRTYTQKGKYGAGDESRTRDLNLGKVALYQLSYSRIAKSANSNQSIDLVKAEKLLACHSDA